MSSHRMVPVFLSCAVDAAGWPLTHQWKWRYAGRSPLWGDEQGHPREYVLQDTGEDLECALVPEQRRIEEILLQP